MEKLFLTLTHRSCNRREYTRAAIKEAYLYLPYRRGLCRYKGYDAYCHSDWEGRKQFEKDTRPLRKTVAGILARHKIKQADLPTFDDDQVEGFFTGLYEAQHVPCHKEAVWQAVSQPSKVAYSQRKPDGRYTRVVTTLGKWLRRNTTLDDEAIKRLSERYKTLTNPTDGLTLKVCQDADEIYNIYNDDTVCKSCMVGEDCVAVYDSPDISVVYAVHDSTVVGRAVCNRHTKEFVRAYPTESESYSFGGKTNTEWRKAFLALLESEGYRHDTGCLEGLRLRFLDHDAGYNQVAAPYIDGDYQAVTREYGDDWMIVCDKGDDDAYSCDNTNGWSDQRVDGHEGEICIDGTWYDEGDVAYSSYNGEHIHRDDAYYSDHDSDYYYGHQTITVYRLDHRNRPEEEYVHEMNRTTEVEGFIHPILDNDISRFIEAGIIIAIDGEYYEADRPDVVWCAFEERHALRGDSLEINDEWYTLDYVIEHTDEFLVHDGELAYHRNDRHAEGIPLDVVCDTGMAKAIESVYAANYMPAVAQYNDDALCRHLYFNVFPTKAKRLRGFLVSLGLDSLFDDLCSRAADKHPTLVAYREQERNARARAA